MRQQSRKPNRLVFAANLRYNILLNSHVHRSTD
jgi:hypothetical protein